MAQRVLGIDLGAYSVKVAQLEVGFRTIELGSLQTYEVLPGAEGALERALGALAGVAPPDPTDIVCAGLPGDRVLMRLFDVPFTDPRKVQAVVTNELADDIPWDMEEVIFDHVAARPAGAPVTGRVWPAGAAAAVGRPAGASASARARHAGKVLVAAAQREDVRGLLESLAAAGFEPRQLRVAPLSYPYLLRRVYGEQAVLLVDIGHLRTNLCLAADGRPLFARTISRGGHQVTEALRQAFHLSYKEAEALKHEQGLIADDPSELPPAAERVAKATARAIAPLARELRRMLTVASARTGVEPERVVLCGGTAQLAGLDSYLAVESDLPVERLDVSSDAELAGMLLTDEAQLVGALSLGLALEHGRRQSMDFRRGEFAFKADRSLLRDKAVAIVASVAAVLLFAALNAWAAVYSLQSEHEGLATRLSDETRRVFGAPELDPRLAAKRVVAGAKGQGGEIPAGTAVEVLERFSRAVPKKNLETKEKLSVDITKLDIRPGKTYVRGEADSAGAVGTIIRALEADDCFPEVSAGKISEVGEGKKQFSLTITTKCF